MLDASSTSHFKAAKNLREKKAVFRLGNIADVYNTVDVTSQMETLGIRVVSCFELPKRAFLPAGNKQFRICIFAVDRHILLNCDNWAAGITIQEWIFKPKTVETDAAGIVKSAVNSTELVSNLNLANTEQAPTV